MADASIRNVANMLKILFIPMTKISKILAK